jgi:hypothetical protein
MTMSIKNFGVRMRAGKPSTDRAGLTALEFVGCTMAVVGGAWLGALYLGVDVRQVAHTALAEAELLDKMPANLRPAPPNDKAMTREQLVSTLREELGALRSELTSLRTGGEPSAAAPTASPAGEENTLKLPLATKDKTLAYWKRISEIAVGEGALQRDAESASSETNASRVFAIKGRISRFAAKSVEAVPTEGVEESVIRFGRQLALWYDRGGELYEKAVRIWETPTISQNREQLNQEWRRAESQHNNEARLVYEKATAVRSAASRFFGTEFPEFAESAAAAGSLPAGSK